MHIQYDTYTCIYIHMYTNVEGYIWAEIFWEKIEKLGNLYLKPFPNFPIAHFPNRAGPSGLVSFGKLEIGKYVPVIISQFPNFPNSAEPDGLGSFGKLGNGLGEICL